MARSRPLPVVRECPVSGCPLSRHQPSFWLRRRSRPQRVSNTDAQNDTGGVGALDADVHAGRSPLSWCNRGTDSSRRHATMTSARKFIALVSPKRAFGLSLILGAAAVLATAAWSRHVETAVLAQVDAHRLSSQVDVTTQLQPGSLPVISRRYDAVVDLRPDGEAAGQPSSREMEAAAHEGGLDFAYVPVPHGEIPEQAVVRLRTVLDHQHGQVLLYCRSGKRATRTWALAEASRSGGLSAEAIIVAVKGAGQEADDLRSRIEAAVNARVKAGT